ncbi:ADP-ribosyltransferase [Erwinia piriflorinigrans]|uniref:NAD(+)--protein-arginine ADP-ribosyltransferase n=1 Tax=Erwinia piriflorinigrans CFBP 5888 TaxID=1161919 RepID=V5ZA53_9GAMM|nr:ADP-ribosyltransferase [Erwinia piriflorinigrans]CCG87833.1 hypothetical protein EPIR_2470 [Erwinia piriflorinigrans CFBP 5888]
MPHITYAAIAVAQNSVLTASQEESGGSHDYASRGLIPSVISVSDSAIEMTSSPVSSFCQCRKNVFKWFCDCKSEEKLAKDTQWQEVLLKGRELKRLAEDGVRIMQQQDSPPVYSFKLNRKFMWFAGAALVTTGLGTFTYGRQLFGAGLSSSDQHNTGSTAAMGSREAFLSPEPLPTAAPMLAPRESTTHKKPEDIKRVKMDFSCIEERETLTAADILRKIGNTLLSPVEELARESQVIDYMDNMRRCPNDEEIKSLSVITRKVDQVVNAVVSLIPGAMPTVIVQRIGGTLFKMFADNLNGKTVNVQNVVELNNQVLMVAKMIADFSTKNINGQPVDKQVGLPEQTYMNKNLVHIYIKGDEYLLSHQGNKYIATRGEKELEVSYSNKNKIWFPVEETLAIKDTILNRHENLPGKMISHADVIDLKMARTLQDVPQLNAKRFIRTQPNNKGIYRYSISGKKNNKMAVKLNGQFYCVRKGTAQPYLTLDSRPDIEIVNYYGKYYLTSQEEGVGVAYSPCRVTRSPVLPCLAFSGDVERILKNNLDAGMSPDKVGELSAGKKFPTILVSGNGKNYIKHNSLLFRVKIVQEGSARYNKETEVRIFARRRSGFLKRKKEFYIGSGYFSPVAGDGVLTTKIESTMEVFKFTRPTAEAYHLLQDFDNKNGGITSGEYESIRVYGGASYTTINGFLLDDMPEEYISPHIRESAFQHVTNIRKMLKKLPVIHGMVYRGCIPGKQGMKAFAELKPGDIISSKKFISASTEQQVARNFAAAANGVRYKIAVEKAAHPVMLYTGKLTEAEVLIEDNTIFRCKAISCRDIELEEVVNPSGDELARLKYIFI